MTYNNLCDLIVSHDITEIKNILSKSFSIIERDLEWGLLHQAIEEIEYGGSIEVVKLLIEHGLDVNPHYNDNKNTPLHTALTNYNLAVLEILLIAGANPNIKMREFGLPLQYSVIENQYEIIQKLIDYGAYSTINSTSGFCGCTALNIAATKLDVLSIELLLKNGTSTQALDEDGFDSRWHLPELCESNSVLWHQCNTLLEPKNSPFLKLNDGLEKYIICNVEIPSGEILGNFNADTKYLYHDLDLYFLLNWLFENSYLEKEVKEKYNKLHNLEIPTGEIDSLISILGENIYLHYIKEEHRNFIFSYLMVGNWWHNFYFDLKKIFPSDDPLVQIENTIESKKKVFELLNIRNKEFNEQGRMNSNSDIKII